MLSEAEKEHVGNMFFIQRKTGTYAGDKNYIANSEQRKLPDNWDEGYRNIVIFNSSEDEFAAVGDEYDKARLFPTQLGCDCKYSRILKEQPQSESLFTYSSQSNECALQVSYRLAEIRREIS